MSSKRVYFLILLGMLLIASNSLQAQVSNSSDDSFSDFLKEDSELESQKKKNQSLTQQAKNAPDEVPQEALEVFKLEQLRKKRTTKKVVRKKKKEIDPADIEGVRCFSATNLEYLGNRNGYFCGHNWTYPIYISPQSYISSLTVDMDVIFRTDFFETAIFEDKNPLTLMSRRRHKYAKTNVLTVKSDKFQTLEEYLKNFYLILKNENKKLFDSLHAEHREALNNTFKSNYALSPNIKSVVFDAHTPVFTDSPGPIVDEDQVYSLGEDLNYTTNRKFLGLLSSQAVSNLIFLKYKTEEEAQELKKPYIRSWFKSELIHSNQEQVCRGHYLDQPDWQDKRIVDDPVKMSLQILDNFKAYYSEGLQFLVAIAYCLADAAPEISSVIQADKWEEIYRYHHQTDCRIGLTPRFESKDFEEKYEGEIIAENDDSLEKLAKKLQVKQDLLDRAFFGDDNNIEQIEATDVLSEAFFPVYEEPVKKDIIERAIEERYDPSKEPKPAGTDIPEGFYDDPSTPEVETAP